jgi:hypothetical protein
MRPSPPACRRALKQHTDKPKSTQIPENSAYKRVKTNPLNFIAAAKVGKTEGEYDSRYVLLGIE